MANLNKVMLIGNLTRDPELRYTPKGTAVADITLAINRIWNNEQNVRQEETIFVEVTLWGRQAELAQQYLSKGRLAYIEGRLQMDTWDDKETGKKRSKLKVIGETLQFLPDGKGSSGGGGGSGGGSHQQAPQQQGNRPPPQRPGPSQQQGASAAPADHFAEEDDIPF
ncbi:MAG: single-stranded DNA-binding protein [Verrucomicrobia bacterium]|nr:MAG: single-stranded DNA-binding protein [Verrucomicrobiota bacterium]